jgi:hypothetical protein
MGDREVRQQFLELVEPPDPHGSAISRMARMLSSTLRPRKIDTSCGR